MAQCTDNTFRLRVTCSPCTINGGGTCCDNVPRQLCCTFSGQNFPTSPTCDAIDLNGKSVLLTYDNDAGGPHDPDCIGPHSAYGVVNQGWSGEFTMPCSPGYGMRTFRVNLICCGGYYFIRLVETTGTNQLISQDCRNLFPPDLSLGWNYDPGTGLPTEFLTVTCSPFNAAGTLSWQPNALTGVCPFGRNWFIDATIVPVPVGGCGSGGGSGTCCDDELGSHPALSVTQSSGSFVGSGTFTATWSGSNYTWGPTGTNNFMWAMTCPSATAPAGWASVEGIGDAFGNYEMSAPFVCNPFSVAFRADGQAPDFSPVDIGVTL